MAGSIYAWSTTPATNASADGDVNWAEFQDPDTVNNSARQMMARVAEKMGDQWSSRASTGAANVFAITITSSPAALVDGLTVGFYPHQSNTGDCNLAVNSFGNIPLRPAVGVAFLTGEIQSGVPVIASYRSASNEWIVRGNTGYFVNKLGPALFQSQTFGLKVGDVKLSLASSPDAGFVRLAESTTNLLKASYPDLNTWASGQGYPWGSTGTTFGLPGAAGYFLRFGGASTTSVDPRGNVGPGVNQSGQLGSHTHGFSATTSAIGDHTHSYGFSNPLDAGSGGAQSIYGGGGGTYNTTAAGGHSHTVSGTTASTGGTETRPVNVTMYADMLAVPALVASGLIGVGGLAYKFNSATAVADPGAGYFSLNNATPSSASTVSISETDVNGATLASVYDALASGAKLIISKVGSPGNMMVLTLSSSTSDSGTWRSATLSAATSSGTISNGDNVAIQVLLAAAATTAVVLGGTGNGVTDDTIAAQASLAAAVISGERVYVPPGTYICSNLTVTGSLVLFGPGTIKQKASSTGHLITVSGTSTVFKCSDVTLDGNSANQGGNVNNDLVRISSVGGASYGSEALSEFVGVKFKDACWHGIYALGDQSGTTREVLKVTRCRFRNGLDSSNTGPYQTGDILVADGMDATITDSDFLSDAALTNGRAGIFALTLQTAVRTPSRFRITGNQLRYRGSNLTGGIGAIDLYMWSDDSVVANNTITDSGYVAIKTKQHGDSIAIAHNTIATPLSGVPAISMNGCSYLTVGNGHSCHGNIITGVAGAYAIDIDGLGILAAGYPTAISCTDNLIYGCSDGGISCANMARALVSNNIVQGGTIGISVQTCDVLAQVSNNQLSGQSDYSLYVDNNPTANSVASFDLFASGNVISQNTKAASYAAYVEGRHVVLEGNHFRDVVNGVRCGDASGRITSLSLVGNTMRTFSGTVGFSICAGITDLTATGNIVLSTTPFSETSALATSRKITGNSFNTACQRPLPLQTLTDAATIAWDANLGSQAKVTLGANRTFGALTNAVEGTSYLLWIIQDGTGSRTITWTTSGAGSFDFGATGAPTLTTTAANADLLTFEAISIGGTLKLRYRSITKGFA